MKKLLIGLIATAFTFATYATEDYSRRDLARALINYEANARIKAYLYDQSLLFMNAPGTKWAIAAASQVGGLSANNSNSLKLSNQSLLYSIGFLSAKDKIDFGTGLIFNPSDPKSGNQKSRVMQMYDELKTYMTKGEGDNIFLLNPAAILEANVLNSKQLALVKGPDANASNRIFPNLINVLVDPFPADLSAIQKKIVKAANENELDRSLLGPEKELVARSAADGAVLSLSANVFSDIITRRTASTTGLSQMQIMEENSSKRVKNLDDWYPKMSAASEAAVLREIAYMMAYSMWMQQQQYRMQEQQTALLATMNSAMTRLNTVMTVMAGQIGSAQALASSTAAAAQAQRQIEGITPPSATTKGS